jgi:hypothetical protein
MNSTAIFWPMIAHVALVFAIYALMSQRRVAAIKAGKASTSQFRENRDEPAESLFVRNNLENQFELPVLFHIGCLALFVTGAATWPAVALAWLFVASRGIHAWIHVTTNRIRHRRPAFIAGFVVLAAMWAWLAASLLLAG